MLFTYFSLGIPDKLASERVDIFGSFVEYSLDLQHLQDIKSHILTHKSIYGFGSFIIIIIKYI